MQPSATSAPSTHTTPLLAGPTLPAIPFIGNATYCYANSTAMLIAAAGETITPARIEVLSGVGLGGLWLPDVPMLFFGSGTPDSGVSAALTLLGFAFTEEASADDAAMPLDVLRAALRQGPAVLGPLDMSELVYSPFRPQSHDVDHFVLVYGMDDAEVYLHDPADFPHVSLTIAQLDRAWRADDIAYRRGRYRFWHTLRRERQPSEQEIMMAAITQFQTLYHEADGMAAAGLIIGSNAIRTGGAQLRTDKPSAALTGSLTYFTLPLGAKRALDYAAFFQSVYPQLADLKRLQAVHFGRTQTLAMRAEWASVADQLEVLATIEDHFRAELMAL